MYNTQELLRQIAAEGDLEKMKALGDLLEELISEAADQEKYQETLHYLWYGPHLCSQDLPAGIKYTESEIARHVEGLGLKFGDTTTTADICYVTNHLYQLYYPLLPDIEKALKFAERFIHDPGCQNKVWNTWKSRKGKL